MNGWAFAFTRRWAGYLALTILFACVCAGLGVWQLARRNEALAEIALVADNYDSDPVPVAEALPDLAGYDDDDQKWLPVEMHGSYLVDQQLLVRNRPLNGNPGFEVLTPLKLDDGTVFVVDRGWLPIGSAQDAPDEVPAPPSGEVTVVARLKAGEPSIPSRTAGEGQIATIQLDDIAARVGADTYTGAYGLLASESPAARDQPPAAVTKPQPDEGPHLSYAFQWFVFGLMAFVGLGYAVRQEYRTVNADDPEERERAAERERRRSARKRSDSEIEDEILGSR
ncbi:SURF1 family protein [Compostimonas suwonensis]|uniref:SURF1-like protein n=1 Tax=Compostimonas suwonensis TaxID=1048394 RepID=A0A2M9BYQ4_9MICO|nr:SURF1 family protein [Compostimonas suwonensis]PJJ63200.1 cytochrome oxidase assembly protein ShyY1 [Compostimonas suwonensis]